MTPERLGCAGLLVSPLLAGCSADALPWGFAGLALVLAAGGAGVAGWLLAQARQGRALHDARQQARLAAALAPGTGWQTDGGHQLLPGPIDAEGRLLWDVFDAGAAAQRLRQTLQRQAAIDDLAVVRADDGSLWQLRAEPRFDVAGAFAGHQGVALPLDSAGPARAALDTLVDDAAGAVLAAVRAPDGGGWRVLRANAAAQARFGSQPLLSDDRLRAGLPAGLQRAFDGAEAAAEADGWQLRRPPPSDPSQQALCLVWQSDPAPAADEQASFSYTVSHDLRAPIRVVEGFTRIVKEDYGGQLDRVANDHLDRVLGATARMNHMIDAMLTLARLSTQPLARQPVNLSQLAGFVVDDLKRGGPERLVDIEIEPGLQVQGDPTLLRLVLENLLGNAWKYTGRRDHAQIRFGRETVDGRATFVVRDNGAGFDMRSAERLFGLFQRLHSANDFAGTGVGLASVRRIVQRHGGEIWADGEPDRGAAFYFTVRD